MHNETCSRRPAISQINFQLLQMLNCSLRGLELHRECRGFRVFWPCGLPEISGVILAKRILQKCSPGSCGFHSFFVQSGCPVVPLYQLSYLTQLIGLLFFFIVLQEVCGDYRSLPHSFGVAGNCYCWIVASCATYCYTSVTLVVSDWSSFVLFSLLNVLEKINCQGDVPVGRQEF